MLLVECKFSTTYIGFSIAAGLKNKFHQDGRRKEKQYEASRLNNISIWIVNLLSTIFVVWCFGSLTKFVKQLNLCWKQATCISINIFSLCVDNRLFKEQNVKLQLAVVFRDEVNVCKSEALTLLHLYIFKPFKVQHKRLRVVRSCSKTQKGSNFLVQVHFLTLVLKSGNSSWYF